MRGGDLIGLTSLSIRKAGLVLVGLLLTLELLYVGILAALLHQSELELVRQIHAKTVMTETNNLVKLLYDAGSAIFGYAATRSEFFAKRFHQTIEQIDNQFVTLRTLVGEDPDKQKALSRIEQIERRSFVILDRAMATAKRGHSGPAFLRAGGIRQELEAILNELVVQVQVFSRATRQAEAQWEGATQSRKSVQEFLFAGVILNVIIALLLATIFTKRIADRLSVLTDNTIRLSQGKELNPCLDGADEIACLDRVFHDMADSLESAAERERALIRNAVDVICSLDEDGRFTSISPAAQKVWGREPPDLLGRGWLEIVPENERRKASEAFRRTKEVDHISSSEHSAVTSTGLIVPMLWSLHWSQKDRSMFCVAHDITERKRLEQMKEHFIAMASHDLRSPLTAIQGALTSLSTGVYGPLTPKVLDHVQRAEKNAVRLVRLINDLLDFERMQAGKIPMRFRLLEVDELVESSIDALNANFGAKHLSATYAQAKLKAYGDFDRLQQVLVNLLSNAIKFSPGGREIIVACKQAEPWVEISVCDFGPGIAPDLQARIFEPYEQASDATDGGTGLGLAICRAIIAQHNGEIGVCSEQGAGATFWFRIPSASPSTEEG